MNSKIIFKILQYSNSIEIPISNLRLQKILFLVQLSAYRFSLPYLYNEDFEAWRHGPVLYEIYNYFKKYGNDPILLNDKIFDEFKNCQFYYTDNMLLDTIIERVIFYTKDKTDWELVKVTQQFQSWKEHYIQSSQIKIPQKDIKLDSEKFRLWKI